MYFTAFSEFLIVFFILLYSLSTLFTEISSSWLLYEFLKDLWIKTLIIFNFFKVFFRDDWLILLIPAVSSQIYNPNPTAKLVMSTKTLTNLSSSITTDSKNENKKVFKVI